LQFANAVSIVNCESANREKDVIFLTLEPDIEGPALVPQIRVAFTRSLEFANASILWEAGQIVSNVLVNLVQKIRNLVPKIIWKTKSNEIKRQNSTLGLTRVSELLIVASGRSVGLESQVESCRAKPDVPKLVQSLAISLNTDHSFASCVPDRSVIVSAYVELESSSLI
jgi:hypothetical protein